MLRPLILALPAVVALAACSGPTAPRAVPPEPSWRLLGEDEQATTSRCIGQPTSPLCAVETLLACFQRSRIELCRKVDEATDQYAQVFASAPTPGRYLAYRVVEERVVSAPSPGEPTRPVDVFLSLDQREAPVGHPIPEAAGPASDFLLRRQADGTWKIVGWGGPGE